LPRTLGHRKITEPETVDFLLGEAGLTVEALMARVSGYSEIARKLAKDERIASEVGPIART
jgi:hypothetical protein